MAFSSSSTTSGPWYWLDYFPWRVCPRRVFKGVGLAVVCVLTLHILYTVFSLVLTTGRSRSAPCSDWPPERAERRFGPMPEHNAERLRRLRSTCRLAEHGIVDRMTAHAGTRSAYCVVPKTSCTFWLSLYRFLHRDSGTAGYDNPLHIPRAQVHRLTDLQVMKYEGVKSYETLPEDYGDYFRFLFVRDPYSRLWSSYVDKLLLLDFWKVEGDKIVRFLRSAEGLRLMGRATPRAFSPCYSDISFAELAAYVAGSGERAPADLNEHWRPVEHVCNPCLFCPHLVGKVETFAQDSLPALRRLNLSWVLDSYRHERHQMELLLEENFRQLEDADLARSHEFYAACSNASDVSRRLWRAFQMYGYLPMLAPFPSGQLGPRPSAGLFKEVAMRARDAVPENERRLVSAQRKRAMREAYESVPGPVLEKLSSLYMFEFLAFDYDMRPRELFADRYEGRSGSGPSSSSSSAHYHHSGR